MKLICTQKNLIKGLTIVSNIVGKNVSLPILNNILIKVENNTIKLISTNLDIGIKTIIHGKIEKNGEITVPAKLFFDYINLLSPHEQISLEQKENNLIIKAGIQETIIKGQSVEEYPIVPEIEKHTNFKIKIKLFKEALTKVIFAASFDGVRTELTGVLFRNEENLLVMAATDSYRLAEKKVEFDSNSKKINFSKIIPLRVLQELLRILKTDESEIGIEFKDNQIIFSFEETLIVSRLIEGNYPDYQAIIPQTSKTKVEIDKELLIKNIKAISLFAKNGINDILIEFNLNSQQIIISTANLQLGESKAKLPAKIEGQNNEVVFNYKYLLDGLQAINDNKINFNLLSADSPVLLNSLKDQNYLYLIMPIRK